MVVIWAISSYVWCKNDFTLLEGVLNFLVAPQKGEGYKTPTNERACVNSVSIKFNPDKEVEAAVKANAKA